MKRALAASLLLASVNAVAGPNGRYAPVRPSVGPLFNFSVAPAPNALPAGPLDLPGSVAPLSPLAGTLGAQPLALPAAQTGLAPAPGALAAAAGPLATAAGPLAKPGKVQVGASAMKQLGAVAHRAPKGKKAESNPAVGWSFAAQAFDGGGGSRMRDAGPAVEPAFEPPTLRAPESVLEPAPETRSEDSINPGEQLSFQPAQKSALLAAEPEKAIWGIVKRIRANEGSKAYWEAYKRGGQVDIVSRGEPVFGRPTTITEAYTKPLGKLTRDDFAGIVPKPMLQLGVKKLRDALRAQLDEQRRRFNENDPPVGPSTPVRVVKFKSFLELYRETHGPNSVPEPEQPAPRTELKAKAEGALAPLASFLPRAVFLDLDMYDAPVAPEVLSDIAKLQRTGVYFIAFSRKPASENLEKVFLKNMSAYQQSILMPIRFLAVTDNGAVISEFGKGGLRPVGVKAFSEAEVEILRDSAQKAAEDQGLGLKSLKELPPASLGSNEAGRPLQPGRRASYQVELPKSMSEANAQAWVKAFRLRLSYGGIKADPELTRTAKGTWLVTTGTTRLGDSLARVNQAAGDKFGLYLNPGDALVLSEDAALKAANPRLDLAGLTGLKGAELAENVLGLLLGEHRENREGDLAGSASRMASFTRDRQRYMSEKLLQQDGEEQNINFFSGHVVHAANDWLVWNLQNGRVPTEAEFAKHLRDHWEAGLREFKPVGFPSGETAESWLEASTTRAISMYHWIVRVHRRGETLVGTEIPNFFVVKDYERRSGDLRRRYILHTIFDFIALRPDPKRPGHATLVIYDFKTGPTKSRKRLDKDVQVLTYALFARDKWVGKPFPVPYLSGDKAYHIDDAKVEFIYNAIKQPTEIHSWDLDKIRTKIIGTLNRIHAAESRMLGLDAPKKPAKAKTGKAKAAKPKAKKR